MITIIRELPEAQSLLRGIYDCDYGAFFRAVSKLLLVNQLCSCVEHTRHFFISNCCCKSIYLLFSRPLLVCILVSQILQVHPLLLQDRYLGPVAVYLVREYRVLAYAQFLEAYKRCAWIPAHTTH